MLGAWEIHIVGESDEVARCSGDRNGSRTNRGKQALLAQTKKRNNEEVRYAGEAKIG